MNYELQSRPVQLRQRVDQLLKLVDPALRHNICQLHVRIILVKRTYWVLHLSHELLPVVTDNVHVFDCLQIVKIFLTHMHFQLTDIRLWSCDSKQSLLFEILGILSKISRKQPEYKRYLFPLNPLKLLQVLSKNV